LIQHATGDDGNVVTLHLALVFRVTFNKVQAFKADDLNDLAWLKSKWVFVSMILQVLVSQ
jgi:hypothetical protein